MTTRQERALRTRALVIDVAAEEFWERGLWGARVDRILDRAQLTKGALYHHFPGKTDIAQELIREQTAFWKETLSVPSADQGMQRVKSVCSLLISHLVTDMHTRAAIRVLPELGPDLYAVDGYDLMGVWRLSLTEALEQAVALSEVDARLSSRVVAVTTLACLYGVALTPDPVFGKLSPADRLAAVWPMIEKL